MILKKLVIQGYGPFYAATEITIDEKVTILTGQNDVGKSAILRLLQQMFEGIPANEDDINTDRRREAPVEWAKSDDFYCIATFELPENHGTYLQTPRLVRGDEVDIVYYFGRNHRRVIGARRGGGDVDPNGNAVSKLPTALFLPVTEEIRSVIQADTMNTLEQYLMTLAFGENSVAKMTNLQEHNFYGDILNAQNLLNENLKSILPVSLGLELTLYSTSRDPFRLAVGFKDKHGSNTPIHFRGSGVRKIVTLIAALANAIQLSKSDYIYVLFDEPENSLHADSQHKLRALFEELAENPKIQVIYSTHSPSMINPINVNGLRLIKRTRAGRTATSEVENKPYRDNFMPVRISLGLSPIDSLLYAPVTIIIEGETEVKALPYILQRLCEEKIGDFEDLDNTLSLCHIIDGHGSEFEYWCRMAKSQGAKPIIFVDGDQIRHVNQKGINSRHPDVPIIHLDEGKEFEDIVPPDIYFQALSEVTGEKEISHSKYLVWEQATAIPERMFTKRIGRWLKAEFPQVEYRKPDVMKKAVESVKDLSMVQTEKFIELITKIQILLRDL